MKIIHDKLKVHSLTGRITEELMHKAFKAVKKNRGAAGIDKVSIKMYESNLPACISNERLEARNLYACPSTQGTYSKRKGKNPPTGNTRRQMQSGAGSNTPTDKLYI